MASDRAFQHKTKTLTIAVQAAHLRKAFPQAAVMFGSNSSLIWVGVIQPSPLSERYTVRIKYRLCKRPVVTVVEPELAAPNGGKLPHVFSGNHLCLFRYKYFEWDSSMIIATTIVPWTSLWLLYYEIWLASGAWSGSNAEHPGQGGMKQNEQTGNEPVD